MSKEKQIEEMSKEIREEVNGCSSYWSGLIAKHLYEQGYRKQSEWISVEERLPENYEHCLLFLDNETMEIGWYHESAKKFVVGGLITISRVTHWMPLPEAPKMKG